MNEQIKHYADKLAYETDSWDLKVALEAGMAGVGYLQDVRWQPSSSAQRGYELSRWWTRPPEP